MINGPRSAGGSSPPGTPKQQSATVAPFGSPLEAECVPEEEHAGRLSLEAAGARTAAAACSSGEAPQAAAAAPANVGAGGEVLPSGQPLETASSGGLLLPAGLSVRTGSGGHQHAANTELGLSGAASFGHQQHTAAGVAAAGPSVVWGWLQPGRPGLPYVLLQGKGVAIGRGREVYEERLPLLLLASPPTTPTAASGAGSRRAASADGLDSGAARGGTSSVQQQKASAFVEVADGRVSRLHCWIKRGPAGEAVLEDVSTNGTFLNGEKVPRGGCVPLREGDRVSLVLSVAPLAEQFFVYRGGDPRAQDPEAVADWIEAASRAWASSPSGTPYRGSPTAAQLEGQARGGSPRRNSASASAFNLSRSKTSTYATAEATTLDDLQCQICLGTLRACVALEPCGHSFCAACLSHHFANLLSSGQPLACPLRCAAPIRVIANRAVRRLVWVRTQSLKRRHQGAAAATLASAGPSPLGTLHEVSPNIAGCSGSGAVSEPPCLTTIARAAIPQPSPALGLQQPMEEQQQQEAPGPVGPAGSIGSGGSEGAGGPSPAPAGPPSSPFSLDAGAQPTQPQPQPPQQEPADTAVPGSSGGGIEGGAGQAQSWPGGGAGAGPSPAAEPPPGFFGHQQGGEEGEEEEEEELGMNPLCPLYDELLPLDASGLKHRQLAYSVEQLRGAGAPGGAAAALEAIARLGWSDDAMRQEIAELGGIESVIACMQEHAEDDGVQCNACLALMALVRGEGPTSDANKWRVASNKGVECIVAAMRTHREQPMVQLSALLAIVPLALENVFLQAEISNHALPDVLLAIKHHSEEVEVVGKALVVLGVVGQGEEEVHEAIRERIVRSGAPAAIAGVLGTLGTLSEEVLWASLFALAVVMRESSARYVDHMVALAAAGVLPALQAAMEAYRADIETQGTEPDDMILKAGDFLMDSLAKAERLMWLRRRRRAYLVLAVTATALLAYRMIRRQRFAQGKPHMTRFRAAVPSLFCFG